MFRSQPIRFLAMAVILACIGLYHAAALAIPAFAAAAYPTGYPASRHIAFITIDILTAYLFLIRPRWLIWPCLILAAQVFYSHGLHASQVWRQNHRMDWADSVPIAVALYGLTILCLDRPSR